MWSSSGDNNINNNGLSRGSSSSSSSASPFSPLPLNPRAKTMEDVWKDINLASLYHDHHPSKYYTCQNFLATPLSNDPQNPVASTRFASPVPPPATMLTLNSVPELNYFGNSDPLRHNELMQHQNVKQVCPSHSQPFYSFVAASGFPNSNEKKRFNEFGDRRNKRMIKNRESAARSRARKQAYTTELELEVVQLTEENARLKKQQQLYMDAAAQQPEKLKLSRTTTAPF